MSNDKSKSIAFGDARLPLRFWHKVLPIDGGCWIWIAALSQGGYGWFGVSTGRTAYAHRHAYLTLVGPVEPGLDLDHLCRNRDCVNPEHLEPVTRAENAARGMGGQQYAARTHCPKGHPYDEANTRMRKDHHGRECRACHYAAARSYRLWRAEMFPRLRPPTPEQIAELDKALAEAT